MKYFGQFLIIMGFTLVGEALQRLLPLPIPASVYGLLLLFAALCLGAVKLEQVREAGDFLRSLLPLLFISPIAGVLEHWELIKGNLIPMLAMVVVSTVLVFAVSGRIAQYLMKKEGRARE